MGRYDPLSKRVSFKRSLIQNVLFKRKMLFLLHETREMIEKLTSIKHRFEEIEQLIVQPDAMSDMKMYAKLNQEYRALEKIVVKADAWFLAHENLKNTKNLLSTEKDEEFRALAKVEIDVLEPQIDRLDEALKILLIPQDPDDNKNVILEIRAGTGGDEASLFAGDLFKMYRQFSDDQKWKLEPISFSEGTKGFREISLSISGDEVYGKLKFESGVHRVQRVPSTESQGRVHTSAATVAVLPEVEDVDIDLIILIFEKIPFVLLGLGASTSTKQNPLCDSHTSPQVRSLNVKMVAPQHANYDKAMKVLRSRIYEKELKKHNDKISSERKTMVGSGDRSDKIRTYNFPQGRVTDHRIGHTVYNLPNILAGDIQDFIDRLRIAENSERLKDEA